MDASPPFDFALINLTGVSLKGPQRYADPARTRADMAARALEVAQALLPEGKRDGEAWVAPSPFTPGTQLRVIVEGPEAGSGQDGNGSRGDLLDLSTALNIARWGAKPETEADLEALRHEAQEVAMHDAIACEWSGWSMGEVEEMPAPAEALPALAETLPPPPPVEPTAVPSPSADTDPWPEPVDFLAASEHVGEPELKLEHLPEAMAGFAFDTAQRIGVDPAMAALAGVVAATGAMSEEWRVQPKRHDTTWTEGPRLWGALVGDPSVAKTPVLKAAMLPLIQLENAAAAEHDRQMRAYKADLAAHTKSKSPDPAPTAPRRTRYIVRDTTIEALTEVMRADVDAKFEVPLGKVMIFSDELSETVASFDRYKGGSGGQDRAAYLRLYNGDPHSSDRVTRGSVNVPSWAAPLLGGIQPDVIVRIARDAADDGLLQRFCFCVPKGKWKGQDRAPDAAALARYAATFPALIALRPPAKAEAVRFVEAAQKQREAIERLADLLMALPDASTRLKGSLGKVPGQFARLALTFHLIELADARTRGEPEPDPMWISEQTAERTAAYMREVLLPHLLRADTLLFQSSQDGHARWIGGFILSHAGVRDAGRITRRDLQRSYPAFKTAGPDVDRSIAEVMGFLEGMGWVQAEPTKPGERYARAWVVNPKLYEVFAARAAAERQRRDAAREAVTALIQESKRRSD